MQDDQGEGISITSYYLSSTTCVCARLCASHVLAPVLTRRMPGKGREGKLARNTSTRIGNRQG